MAQWLLAFTLGLLIGFLYPRQPLLTTTQNMELHCPEIPACRPIIPDCKPNPVFVEAMETYQTTLMQCFKDLDHLRDQVDSARYENINLRRDYEDLRSR